MKKLLAMLLALCLLCPAALAAAPEGAVSIPYGEKTHIDLDGDGAPESVTLKMDGVPGEEYLALYLFGADGSFHEYAMYVYFMEGAWAADIDGDGLTELMIESDFYSDDYVTYCFRYTEDGGLVNVPFAGLDRFGEAEPLSDGGYGKITAIRGSTLTLTGSQDVLGTWMAARDFTLSGDHFALADGPFIFETGEEDWEYRPLILAQPLEAMLADGSIGVFPAGEKFLPVESDRESYAILTTRDGIECSVQIARNAETGWGYLVNGAADEEIFEYMPYAD